MPELPEVEHARTVLEHRLVGRAITRVDHFNRAVCTPDAGTRLTCLALLEGARIAAIKRHGKQLALCAEDGRVLAVHLGMTGRLALCDPRSPSEPHTHARWHLDDASELRFIDPRRFGGLWTFPSLERLKATLWSRLGPDALNIPPADLACALRGRAPLKSALLDQRNLAGLGNIYADEVLFHARLSPFTPAGELTPQQRTALADAIRTILHKAINCGGSTLRDYLDPLGNRGTYQDRHAVYARAGRPCPSCGRPLDSGRLAQRSTTWCRRCQPHPLNPIRPRSQAKSTDLSTLRKRPRAPLCR
jgi:formamidopyrimidine-DNA glycosylase